MIYLTAESKILLATKPADFRKQIDGLVALCKNHLKQVPNSGSLFVFINKSNTMVRILSYDGTGYWLATKRLSNGRYAWPKNLEDIKNIPAYELTHILKHAVAIK